MIDVERLSLQMGAFAIENLSFSIPAGRYAVLMGRTGCGKTSVLEAVCGLRSITRGRILLKDRDVTHLKTAERDIGYVPQDLALFPTLTVHEHLSFALMIRRWNRNAMRERVEELAGMLGIRHLLSRYPQGLSGGEAQRVALGRALSFRPSILLLDEPLSALDDQTRTEMYDLLSRVQQTTHVTVLHVTHSLTEAQALADALFILEDGRIREVPLERPARPPRAGTDIQTEA